jgi:predicted RNase H-like HicB family nuclease
LKALRREASLPSVRRCLGQTDKEKTEQEAKKNLAEAIGLILTDRREDGLRGVPPDARKEIMTLN